MGYPFDHDRIGTAIKNKDPDSPATTSAAWDEMAPRWMMIETLLGGTEALRRAGQLYLPAHTAEDPSNYEIRRQTSVLLNMFEITLESLSGKPFVEPMKRMDDIPPEVENIFEDVDLLGSNIDTFCSRWFRMGLAKGFSHVLCDYPITQNPDGSVRTLDDDRKQNVRPYWIHIAPENIIFAESTVVNGKETLLHVRIREQSVVREGFSEKTQDFIRVLEPGLVTVYQLVKRAQTPGGKEEWVICDQYATSLDFIPLVTFYAQREGFMLSKPPLQDLAYLNISHFQSSSDQKNILTVTRFPMLACSGVDSEESIVKVGPKQILMTADSAGKFYYVEHTGAAIECGAKDIENLEKQMAGYGAEFLKIAPDRQSATARQLDSAESLSPLGRMVTVFQDCVSTLLGHTAAWLGIEGPPGHVEIDDAYNMDEVSQWEMQTLQAARMGRDISRVAFINELKRRRVLSQDFDAAKDMEALQEEMAEGLVGAGLDLNPGPDPQTGGNNPPPGKPANPSQVPAK